MKKRFTVENDGIAYYVKDNDWEHYRLPEKAVSLYFRRPDRAATIAALLNEEWGQFLAKPE